MARQHNRSLAYVTMKYKLYILLFHDITRIPDELGIGQHAGQFIDQHGAYGQFDGALLTPDTSG